MPESEPIYAYRYMFCILLGKHENELNSPERQSVFKTCTGMHGITSTNAICFQATFFTFVATFKLGTALH